MLAILVVLLHGPNESPYWTKIGSAYNYDNGKRMGKQTNNKLISEISSVDNSVNENVKYKKML